MGTVFELYASESPKVREMAASIAMARNQEFARLDEAIEDGDELALMPPVSGGSAWSHEIEEDSGFYALTAETIDSRALAARIQRDDDGAVIVFEGVVRNHSGDRRTRYLDYECYAPMALKTMAEIGAEILKGFDIHRIAMVHRLGRLQIREASVVIAVASAHRLAAYEASLEAINRLKKLVPIWKKEYFEDGEVWVEGDWDDSVARGVGMRR
jgi:molybdopterin synthase catalytic subunit